MKRRRCDACEGRGGDRYFIEPNAYLDARPSAFANSDKYKWIECGRCNGKGYIEVPSPSSGDKR